MLTGRVFVEFSEHEASLDDLISDVTGQELPELPEEDRPAYPLDSGPWIRSLTRIIGTGLGLGLLTIRRIAGITTPLPGADGAMEIVMGSVVANRVQQSG